MWIPEYPLDIESDVNLAKMLLAGKREVSIEFLRVRISSDDSYLQEILNILEQRGMVWPEDGDKPRQVYIKEEPYRNSPRKKNWRFLKKYWPNIGFATWYIISISILVWSLIKADKNNEIRIRDQIIEVWSEMSEAFGITVAPEWKEESGIWKILGGNIPDKIEALISRSDIHMQQTWAPKWDDEIIIARENNTSQRLRKLLIQFQDKLWDTPEKREKLKYILKNLDTCKEGDNLAFTGLSCFMIVLICAFGMFETRHLEE